MSNWAERQPHDSYGDPPNFNTKKVPETVVVFGATGHLGGPVAAHLTRVAPGIQLRLITSNPAGVEGLQRDYPRAEVMVANILDLPATMRAMDGMEGAFVTTTSLVDAKRAMTNVVASAYQSGTLRHLVRFAGENVDVRSEGDLHPLVRDLYTDAKSNLHARQVLEISDLPWTICNGASWFMDNYIRFFGSGIREQRTLATAHNIMTSFADSRDFGEACANVLLSDDIRNICRTFNFDNGHDQMTQDQVAELMSDVLGEKIAYQGNPQSYLKVCAQDIEGLRQQACAALGVEVPYDTMTDYLIRYFDWEIMVEKIMVKSGWMEYFLGRPPVTLAEWLDEHRDVLLGTAPAAMATRFNTPRPGQLLAKEDGLSRNPHLKVARA